MANKKDLAENRQDLLQIGILSLWVQYSTRNMGLPSAKRKSDKTQIGLFIGSEVFHFDGDYDIIKTKISTAIPHNSKHRSGGCGTASALPKCSIMSGCGTRIVFRGQKPLALCDRCPCFGSLYPPPAALTFAAQSIICAFGLAAAAPRLPYRHLELCGIALDFVLRVCLVGVTTMR